MKYFAALLLAAVVWCDPGYAQQTGPYTVYAYSGSINAYIGGTYVRFGQDFGLGVSLALNENTFALDSDAVTMNDGEINDNENAYRYDDEFRYDRGFLTGRLYLRMGGSLASSSTWLYGGVGPGWQRYYYGYERSGTSDTVYVIDSDLSVGHTEVEAGLAGLFGGTYLSVGVSALNFSKAAQLTWGVGIAL